MARKVMTIEEAVKEVYQRQQELSKELGRLEQVLKTSQEAAASAPTDDPLAEIKSRLEQLAQREPVTQVIDQTKVVREVVESFDATSIHEKIDRLAETIPEVPEQDYQLDLRQGKYRLRQPDGEWSPWYSLNGGGGGLSKGQIQKIILEELTNFEDTDTRTNVSEDGNQLVSLVTDINFTGSGVEVTDDGDGSVTVTITDTNTQNPDQNLWSTFVADSGSASADTTSDSLGVLGGAGIDTQIIGDNLFITNTSPAPSGSFVPEAIKVNAEGQSDQSLTQGSETVVQFGNVDYNIGSIAFDNANDKLTIGTTGVYHLSSSLFLNSPTVGVLSDVYVAIQVDRGAGFQIEAQTLIANDTIGTNAQLTIATDTDLQLDEGDEVRLVVFYNSTLGGILSLIFSTEGELNWLTAHRVA